MNDQERSIIRALQNSQPILGNFKLPNRAPRKTSNRNTMASSPEDRPAVELTNSPNRMNSPTNDKAFTIVPEAQQRKTDTARLNPYTRPLTVADLDSVEALENAAFTDPEERATREKLLYRLTKCGELCLGIFVTIDRSSQEKAETLATGKPVETSRPTAISVLIGHVIAAKTTQPYVTDDSMDYPKDWATATSASSDIGHEEAGRTIVLHSVAVLPHFQGRGMGRVLAMAYMQQMNGAGIADRLALIAHDQMVPWYEKLGFTNKGKSICTFGGGNWFDMIYDLKTLQARATYG